MGYDRSMGGEDEVASFARKRRWFHIHAASIAVATLCLIGGAALGIIVVFGLGGLALLVAGVAGFRAERTLIRGRGPILDGFVGDDQYVDGAPLDGMNTLALYAAIAGGLFLAIFGFALGTNQILELLGR